MTTRPVLAIMARAPSAGGKTRLIQELGTSDGEGLRRALLRDTFGAVATLPVDKAVLFTPPDREDEVRALAPFPAMLVPQRGETLGDRMWAGFRELFERRFDSVVLIGSDLPTVPREHVAAAFQVLTHRREALVLGPAEDGGYYLIGLTECHRPLFAGIPWGTPHVLERTLAAAKALGLTVGHVPEWYDVDSSADLRRIWRGPAPTTARATYHWLASAPADVMARVG